MTEDTAPEAENADEAAAVPDAEQGQTGETEDADVALSVQSLEPYEFEDEDGIIDLAGVEGYYGELSYQMQYKSIKGEPFPWLFIDPETLREQAAVHGFYCDILVRGEHYDYLARLTRRT